jgi:hypothetical protein
VKEGRKEGKKVLTKSAKVDIKKDEWKRKEAMKEGAHKKCKGSHIFSFVYFGPSLG